MKKTISKGLMEQQKHDTLLFIDKLPTATTMNDVIQEEFIRRDGLKIKATKYTFPYDQLDDIIERIKEIVIEILIASSNSTIVCGNFIEKSIAPI
ncbi:MAG: hypothetical protein EZS28_005549 [Streblomastix strix]|uniref:Uncharacterized protein n=1 Tax=Streblomastix strix TaxID=222440 RepID=A0A5J4WXG9_9EUKA|nr:MAG: hypothetical protein EZS28_005549 [Streblomastix strix]